MNASKSVTATFTAVDQVLDVTVDGDGSGTVSSAPDGITCPGDCTEAYAPGTSVTLTADPDLGSEFAGWSGGGCGDTDLTCTVTMGGPRSVTATFNLAPPAPP